MQSTMSGNSQDRRRFRRAVRQAIETAIGFSLPQQPPTSLWGKLSSWPVISAVAAILLTVGIAMMLAPVIFPDIFFALTALVVLGKFFSWAAFKQASRRARIQSTAVLLFSAFAILAPLVFLNHKTTPFPVPWVDAIYESEDNAGIQVLLRDYPFDLAGNIKASKVSLFHLTIRVFEIVSVSEQAEGWKESEVLSLQKDEWNSGDANQLRKWIPLNGQYKVLEFWGSSRDALWSGYLILRKNKNHIERTVAFRGSITLPRKSEQVVLTEEHWFDESGQIKRWDSRQFQPLSKKQLIAYGIPVEVTKPRSSQP